MVDQNQPNSDSSATMTMADNARDESPSVSPIPSIARSSDADNGASKSTNGRIRPCPLFHSTGVDQAVDDHSQELSSPKDESVVRSLVTVGRLLTIADARKR